MFTFKLASASIIFFITLASGSFPFMKKLKAKKHFHMPRAEALAAGIFLGAGLIHMLGDAANDFNTLNIDYPYPFLIAGSVFLLFLLMEHIAKELYAQGDKSKTPFAAVATLMLSIHGFLAGSALGLTNSFSVAVIVFIAIIAHKWAESFALALQIARSDISMKKGLLLFAVFSIMTPAGIFFGSYASEYLANYRLVEPLFLAIASGTFIYFGSLHGLEKSVLITDCCNLRVFSYVIFGFALMAVIAIWS